MLKSRFLANISIFRTNKPWAYVPVPLLLKGDYPPATPFQLCQPPVFLKKPWELRPKVVFPLADLRRMDTV